MPLGFSKIDEEYLNKIEPSGIVWVRLKISQINFQCIRIIH